MSQSYCRRLYSKEVSTFNERLKLVGALIFVTKPTDQPPPPCSVPIKKGIVYVCYGREISCPSIRKQTLGLYLNVPRERIGTP